MKSIGIWRGGKLVGYVSHVIWSPCGICEGTGRAVTTRYRLQDPPCLMCGGKGKLPSEVCRGCGRPAWAIEEGWPTCGRKECLAKVLPKAAIAGQPVQTDAELEALEAEYEAQFVRYGVTGWCC